MDNSVPNSSYKRRYWKNLLTSPEEIGKETIDIRNYVGDIVIQESIIYKLYDYGTVNMW